MKPWVRWLVIVGSIALVVVLFVVLRPDDSGDSASPSTPTPTSSPSVTASGSPSPSPSPEPERTVIEVTFRDGAVQGPTSFSATQGDRVRIIVHADVSDEVHLHGYNLMSDVTPEQPARIDFVADVPGVFECELEDAGIPLFELEVSP
ncbi:MAG TPA: hypothetical protein VFC08_07140 [Actinomycetota bacterium]|jgi:hypothetical protein|nr:hypothetical protein [Actinomycetota bacterium]